nr:cyclic dof factor 2 [Ipomoea batatas]
MTANSTVALGREGADVDELIHKSQRMMNKRSGYWISANFESWKVRLLGCLLLSFHFTWLQEKLLSKGVFLGWEKDQIRDMDELERTSFAKTSKTENDQTETNNSQQKTLKKPDKILLALVGQLVWIQSSGTTTINNVSTNARHFCKEFARGGKNPPQEGSYANIMAFLRPVPCLRWSPLPFRMECGSSSCSHLPPSWISYARVLAAHLIGIAAVPGPWSLPLVGSTISNAANQVAIKFLLLILPRKAF